MKAAADVSGYYPPRARWYTRLFYAPAARARRRFHLDRFLLRGGLSAGDLLLGIALPGYAFWALHRRTLAWIVASCYALAALIFIAVLGYPAANIAFGMMISIHVTSIVFLEGLWLGDSAFRVRLGVALCTLGAVWALAYAPAVGYAERHWFVPMRVGNHVFVVHPTGAPLIRRGDLIAFEIRDRNISNYRPGRIVLEPGLAMNRVLALPGDHVGFVNGQLLVNGRPVVAPPNLPQTGEFVIPGKTWLIWPQFDINTHGVPLAEIQAAIQEAAFVQADQIIGKPFTRWFGRRQTL